MDWEFSFLHSIQGMHNPFLDKLMIIFSTLGNNGYIWVFIALLFICMAKYRKIGIQMVGGLTGMLLIGNYCIKLIVKRQRPCWIDQTVTLLIKNPSDYSFPSGHTYAGFVAATVIFLNNKKMGIVAYVVAAIIAFSRMYLFVHFPTDILAGMVLGILTGLASWCLYNLYKKKKENCEK